MVTEKVRLAFVGLGGWGKALANAAVRTGMIDVRWCYARTEESRKAFADAYSCRSSSTIDEILRDQEVEGVVISTPHSTHESYVCQFASAGKHVFIEKPLALTIQSAKREIDAARKAGVVLQVGHHRRKLGATRRIREFIDQNELGMVHLLEANFSVPNWQKAGQGWRGDPLERPAGGMTGQGIHMVDNFHYLVGPVKRVFSFSKKLLGKTNLNDVTTVTFEFENGALGNLGNAIVIPKTVNLAVFGTEGAAWSEEDGSRFYFQENNENARKEFPVDPGDPLAEQMKEFVSCIREGGSPETGGSEGLEVVAVLEAILESIRTERAVEVRHPE